MRRPASVAVLGFCYILRVDGDDPHSLIFAHAKFRLQNRDDELAGREVIVDEDDFLQTRPFNLYLILDLGLGGGANHVRTTFVGHGRARSLCQSQTEAAYGATSIRSQHPTPPGSNLAYDNVQRPL